MQDSINSSVIHLYPQWNNDPNTPFDGHLLTTCMQFKTTFDLRNLLCPMNWEHLFLFHSSYKHIYYALLRSAIPWKLAISWLTIGNGSVRFGSVRFERVKTEPFKSFETWTEPNKTPKLLDRTVKKKSNR